MAASALSDLPNLPFAGITDLAAAYLAGSLSPVEVTQAMLDRIARLDGALHSYLTPTPEVALAQARAAEAEMQRGQFLGPMHGIPIGIKDLCNTAGVRTTAPFDMSGSPTITLPGAFTAGGAPIGFQLVGRHLDEALLVRAGHAFQQATGLHGRHPAL